MDAELARAAASQLVRALRGKRSQVAFSRRLSFRSNVAADWENGRRYPRLSLLMASGPRLGVDVSGAMERFHPPAAPAIVEGIGPWLSALAGRTTQIALAERADVSRHQVGRWLSGKAEPRLPELLQLVEAATGRVHDLVAELVPITEVPALAARHAAALRARRTVFDHPWAAALLPLLETAPYRELPQHDDAWVAERLGIPVGIAAETREALVQSGAARWKGARLVVDGGLTIDTRASVSDKNRLRRFWADRGAERVGDGLTAFNVFAVPRDDLERIKALQLKFFREMRSLVAAAEPAASDAVGLVVVQVLELASPDERSD